MMIEQLENQTFRRRSPMRRDKTNWNGNSPKELKSGKDPGPDGIHTEFIIHLDSSVIDWLRLFLSSCLCPTSLQPTPRAIVLSVSSVSLSS